VFYQSLEGEGLKRKNTLNKSRDSDNGWRL